MRLKDEAQRWPTVVSACIPLVKAQQWMRELISPMNLEDARSEWLLNNELTSIMKGNTGSRTNSNSVRVQK